MIVTASLSPAMAPRLIAASPAAEDGSQKRPSSEASSSQAATISSSETVTTVAPESRTLASVHGISDPDR